MNHGLTRRDFNLRLPIDFNVLLREERLERERTPQTPHSFPKKNKSNLKKIFATRQNL